MSVNLFRDRGVSLDKQKFTWRDLVQTPISKLDDDAFTHSGPVGSVPIPTSLRGMASGVQEKIVNGNHIFMDKLGERIAFERTGTRLYEALISKYEGTESSVLPDKERLYQFHSEELSHFHLLVDVMEKLGGDPTAMTPCADVAGTAAFGWLQVISDPRTSFLQCLNVMLQAELTDNASWELLVKLAESTGLTDVADQFREAMVQEAVHLATVKQWVEELTINQKVLTKGIVSGLLLSKIFFKTHKS